MDILEIIREEILSNAEWRNEKEFDIECSKTIYDVFQKTFRDLSKQMPVMMAGVTELDFKDAKFEKYMSPWGILHTIKQTLTTGYRITPTTKNDE